MLNKRQSDIRWNCIFSITALSIKAIFLYNQCSELYFLIIITKIIFAVISLTELPNIALGKPAEQSTTKRDYNAAYGAVYAVDGNRGTNFLEHKCAHTADGDTSPWWRVDLQAVYQISSVRIHNRGTDRWNTGKRTN